MSFATILKKLRLADLASRAVADDDFAELVSDAARDMPVTPERISSVLEACGKTLADLENAVGKEQQRIADLSTAARRAEILDSLHENNQARIVEDQRYDAAIKSLFESHGAAVSAIVARGKRLDEELTKITEAERRLIDTEAPGRLAEIDNELCELVKKEQRLATISLQSDRSIQRQREAIPGKRASLIKERDSIIAGILQED